MPQHQFDWPPTWKMIRGTSETRCNCSTIFTTNYFRVVIRHVAMTSEFVSILTRIPRQMFLPPFFKCHRSIPAQMLSSIFSNLTRTFQSCCPSMSFQIGSINQVPTQWQQRIKSSTRRSFQFACVAIKMGRKWLTIWRRFNLPLLIQFRSNAREF